MTESTLDVYLTVDVECSMGGAWGRPERRPVSPEQRMLCRNDQGEWGTGFLAGELLHHRLRATFFTEMFTADIFGEEPLRRVTGGLLDAGQDVQLHLHPIFHRYAERLAGRDDLAPTRPSAWPDAFTSYGEPEQSRLIDRGAELFRRIVGREAVAFRAGGYMADRATLRCLAQAGILLDSSANPASPESFPGMSIPPNRACPLEGIWEVPVTVARTRFPDRGPLKHLEISALSFGELRSALLSAFGGGLRHVVLVFHSFSAVKARDPGYGRFRPDRLVIGRLRRLLRFLSENPATFRVRTFSDLAQEGFEEPVAHQPAHLPDLGPVRPFLRKAVQGINRAYWV
jgi:hypothetical protein